MLGIHLLVVADVFLVGVSFRRVNREIGFAATFRIRSRPHQGRKGFLRQKDRLQAKRHACNLLQNMSRRILSNFPLAMNRKTSIMSNRQSPKKTRDTV
ncbi:MAG: hypothetical protein DME18_01690 [Verrucomicrobia bacterium]|nr:MAG: hypothetical protein DME18_01690 [Verrucomicrobiota bacterium]